MRVAQFTRTSATVVHLLISVAIAAVIVALFWGVWYPDGLAIVAGASELLMIVVTVDVLIGPLLTLIVFVPGKKGLARDLFIIALLQLGALGYGVHIMLHTRPVFLVALVDGMLLVSANEIDEADLKRSSSPEYARKSWTGPILVSSQDPQDPKRVTELTISIIQGGPEIERLPEFYGPFEPMAKELVKRSVRLSSWSDSNDPDARQALRWVKKRGLDAGTVSVVSIAGRGGISAMLLDTATAKPLRVFDFNPVPTSPPPAAAAKSEASQLSADTAAANAPAEPEKN
jgi:hypothetical protein